MANDFKRGIRVYLETSDYGRGIDQMVAATKKYEKELADLTAETKRMTDAGVNSGKAWNDVQLKMSRLETQINKSKATEEDYKAKLKQTEKVLNNLSGVSYNELIDVQKKLQKELKATTRGTDEHKNKLEQYERVSKQVGKAQAEMNSHLGSQEGIMSKLGNATNKYFAMVTAIVAVVTGLTMALKKFMDARNELEDASANLQALTGLGDSDVKKLENFAKEMATKPLEGTAIRIRSSVAEIMEAYKLVGSAKPELLKTPEALNEVTKQSMILAAAAGMPLKEAVEGTVIALNQYSAGAEDAARYVNVLAAGSKEGAVEVPYITTALVKFGVLAKMANVPIEQSVSLIETLGKQGFEAEITGTGLKKIFTVLLTGAKETNPALVGMTTALDNLSKKYSGVSGFKGLKDLFGEKEVVIAKNLIENRNLFNQLTPAITGTSIALEQAGTTSKTVAAKLAQAQNRFMILGMELVQNLNPAVLKATNLGSLFIKMLVKMPAWFKENGTTLIALTAAITAYTFAVNVSTIAAKAKLLIDKAQEIIHAAKILGLRIRIALTNQASAAEIRLLGTQEALNASMKRNMWGLIAAGIAVALVYLVDWMKKSVELSEAQKIQMGIAEKQKELTQENSKAVLQEQSELTSLVTAIVNTNDNQEIRNRLIDELNKKYPGFISFIDKEKVSNDLLLAALKDVNDQYSIKLKNKALESKGQAYEDAAVKALTRRIEIEEELKRLRSDYTKDNEKRIKELNAEDMLLSKNIEGYQKQSSTYRAEAAQNEEELKKMNTADYYKSQMKVWGDAGTEFKKKYDAAKADGKEDQAKYFGQQLHLANEYFKFSVIKYKELKKVKDDSNKVNPIETDVNNPEDPKDILKKKLEALETELHKEEIILKQAKIEGKKSEEIYNSELLDLQIKYLKKKRDLYQVGGKEYTDFENQIQDAILKKQTDADDHLLKSLEDSYKSKQIATTEYEKLEKEKLLKGFEEKRQIIQQDYDNGIVDFEEFSRQNEVAQQKLDAELLALEEATSSRRLADAKEYLSLVSIAEFKNGDTKKKAVETANDYVIKAGEKLAEATNKLNDKLLQNDKDYQERRRKAREELGLDVESTIKKQYDRELKLLKRKLKTAEATEKQSAEAILALKARTVAKYAQAALEVENAVADAVSAYHQSETDSLEAEKQKQLSLAGDNAEKRQAVEQEFAQKELDLKKKQAGANAAIQVAQAITAGALAVANIWAVHAANPILAGILTALSVVTVGAQVFSIIKQAETIQNTTLDTSASSGGSTGGATGARVVNQAANGRWDVMGEEDGRVYRNVPYQGVARTGIISSPTLVAEQGDEVIIDNPTLRNLRMNAPYVLDIIKQNRVSQRAAGNYQALKNENVNSQISKEDNEYNSLIAANTTVMNKTVELLTYLKDNGVDAFLLLSEFEKKVALRDKSLKKGSLK